jgi:acetyltransferase
MTPFKRRMPRNDYSADSGHLSPSTKEEEMSSQATIRHLFEPESIAVIGASGTPGKIGYSVVRNIIQSGYKGKIYPINPKGEVILGVKSFTDVKDVPTFIDVTVICVPAKMTLEAVKNCVDRGTKYISIITSGFGEVGDHETEDAIVAYAKQGGARVLGPNIFGVFSAAGNCNATFSASKILPGHVAILTQSGALGIAMVGKTAANNLGLSAMVSIGNKADLDEADCLEYVMNDKNTKVILMYIEGVKDGVRFMEMLKKTTAIKPVIILKSGRSQRGAMAAASHTGSLAGSDEIFDAVIKQCGALRADTLEAAFNWCDFLAHAPAPKGRNCVIVTNGGGIGVMATDACEKYNVDLFDNKEVLENAYRAVTPAFGSMKNPVDITGGATSGDYNLALSATVENDTMDATMALYCETATFDIENLAPMVRDTYQKHMAAGKPIVYALVGGEAVGEALKGLQKENIPAYSDVDHAVSSLASTYSWRKYLGERSDAEEWAKIDSAKINQIIDKALADGRTFLLANEGAEVMNAAGITIPGSKIATSREQAQEFGEKIGYPLVMKVVSRDILHKSDAGGVVLNIKNKEGVAQAYDTIMTNCKKHNASAVIDGIEVTEMVSQGTELIVGARRDAAF